MSKRIGLQNLMSENVIKMFAEAATEHQSKFGTTDEQFAKCAASSKIFILSIKSLLNCIQKPPPLCE